MVSQMLEWGELIASDGWKVFIAVRGDFNLSVSSGVPDYHWRIYRNKKLQSRGTESSGTAAKLAAEAGLEKLKGDLDA